MQKILPSTFSFLNRLPKQTVIAGAAAVAAVAAGVLTYMAYSSDNLTPQIKNCLLPVDLRQKIKIEPLNCTLGEEGMEIALPKELQDLDEMLDPLRRKIECLYRDLPWPKQMQNIVVYTRTSGGYGDIAAAAKAIAVMQRISPDMTFDWRVWGYKMHTNLTSFLTLDDPSKVYINSPEKAPGDFLLTGPVEFDDIRYLTSQVLHRKINGPAFHFLEIAKSPNSDEPIFMKGQAEKAPLQTSNDEIYRSIHKLAFPSSKLRAAGGGTLSMGLQPGSGVFLDKSRIEAPLSHEYSCPSYLKKIQEAELRRDILEAMNVSDCSLCTGQKINS